MQKTAKLGIPTFLKWAGGKQQVLEQYNKKFPKKIKYYVEPFLGGGAVLFYILKYKKPKTVRAFDSNKDLINTYLQIKNNLKNLISLLKYYETNHNNNKNPKLYYIRRRRDFNNIKSFRTITRKNKLKNAALFIYLNKTCYNGLYRVNSKGEFNVPFNGNNKINLFDKEKLIEANELLNRGKVEIKCKDFRKIKVYKKDCIYFDPPYWSNSKKKSFTKYTLSDFDKKSQEELAKRFIKFYKKGCKLILSNSNTLLITQLYNDSNFLIHKDIMVRRMINCNGDKREKIREILITANL